MKKLHSFSFIFTILAVLLTAALFAAVYPLRSVRASAASVDRNFYFESASVRVEVGKDKRLHITEELEVGFTYGGVNTGIIRDIQRISRTTRFIDGSEKEGSRYIANLSDVSVTIDGAPAKVTLSVLEEGDFHSVKMQKADESYFGATEEEGTHLFALSYVYDMSDDKAAGYDDLTFDIWGYEMARCGAFRATIVFPENIPADSYTVRTARNQFWQPDEEAGEGIAVAGNTVEIFAASRKKNAGLTLQVLLPEGYFSEVGSAHFFPQYLIAIFALIAGMGGSFALISCYRARKPIESVEFYPPEGMSLARFSAVWHGRTKTKDLAGYLLKWAGEGCVRIAQDGKSDFIAVRVGDLPESAEAEERAFFEALFSDSREPGVFRTKSPARAAVSDAAEELQKKADAPDPLVGGRKRYQILIAVCSLLPLLGLLGYFSLLNYTVLPLLFSIFMIAGTFFGAMMLTTRGMPAFGALFPVAFMAMPVLMFGLVFYMPMYDYAGLLWITLAWWAVSFVFQFLYGRRTEEAQREYGRMRGFCTFLLTAEKERIEYFLKSDPNYFYNVLPYCLVMGVSDKVTKRYSSLAKALPEWANWNMRTFSRACSRSCTHYSSSSGGRSGGGGGGRHGSHGGGGGGGRSRGC